MTWRSGTSIRGDHPSRKGNKILKSPVPLRLCRTEGSSVEGLLRPETSRRQTPQSGSHISRPAPLRHPLRHAQRRHLLRTPPTLSCLTKTIEAPPPASPSPSGQMTHHAALSARSAPSTTSPARRSMRSRPGHVRRAKPRPWSHAHAAQNSLQPGSPRT